MDNGVKNFFKIGGAITVLLVCVIWIVTSFAGTRVGSTGNNGNVIGMPTPPPTAIKMMEKMVEKSDEMADKDWTDPNVRSNMQMEMMKSMAGEDPEVIREAFGEMQKQMDKMQRALGPEQAAMMMERMRTRMPQIMEQIKKERAKTEGAEAK